MWVYSGDMGNSNNCKGLNNLILKLRCMLLHSLLNCSIFSVLLISISSHMVVWFDGCCSRSIALHKYIFFVKLKIFYPCTSLVIQIISTQFTVHIIVYLVITFSSCMFTIINIFMIKARIFFKDLYTKKSRFLS